MKSYYKLMREEDIILTLQSRLLDNRKWKDQLKGKFPCRNYSLTEGYGELQKSVPLNELPPIFILQQQKPAVSSLIMDAFIKAISPVARLRDLKNIFTSQEALSLQHGETDQPLLVYNLTKISPKTLEYVLQDLDVLERAKGNPEQLLENFADERDSIFHVAPQYISRNFPLTYSEEMTYNTIFAQHPLVGYERMLVPLEKYYKFLSEQNFNEFLTILVKLGVKKIELVYSENKLIKNALNAYGEHKIIKASSEYTEVTAESSHFYWGMEFEGKQISPNEISINFLDQFPFHRNNGTLKAMIEGIKSGNRNKIYTVERSFTGTYGLDVKSVIKVLGFEAGFDFKRETYNDEKSTFNVLY